MTDSVFGYDFFVSYKWIDGRQYAIKLAEALEHRGFEVFLDSERYGQGDDWKKIGAWTLRRTGQMILVGTKLALEPGKTETPVEREVRIFSTTNRRIIPITFVSQRADGSFDDSTSSIECARPTSNLLRYIPPEILVVRESADQQFTGPSVEAVERIAKTFTIVRQDKKRLRIFGAISVVLAALAVVAVVLGSLAEISRRTVANQLAERFYNSSSQTTNPMVEFLLTAKAAEASTSTNPKLPDYLDRLVQLGSTMPNRVLNLPTTEGVSFAVFNQTLNRVAIVTENRRLQIFKLPDLKEEFVPDFVNRYGVAENTQPSFDEDGTTLRTWLTWTHPEPALDETRPYVLKADWNVETKEILTPVNDGQISWEDLEWTVVSSTEQDAAGLKFPLVAASQNISPDLSSVLPLALLELFGMRGGRTDSSRIAVAAASGQILFWNRGEDRSLVSVKSIESDVTSWRSAFFTANRLVTLDTKNTLSVREKDGTKKLWSKTIPSGIETVTITPDENAIVAGNVVYRLVDGSSIGTLAENDKSDYSFLGRALTNDVTEVSAWSFNTGNGDVLSIDVAGVNGAVNEQPFKSDCKPTEFLEFLTNGAYFLAGRDGSFQIRDSNGVPLATFSFGNNSRLSPESARKILQTVVAIRSDPTAQRATLVLRGGAELTIVIGATVNRDLNRAKDGAAIVDPRSSGARVFSRMLLSSDARWMATFRSEDQVQIWDVATGFRVSNELAIEGGVADLRFASDNRRLLIATKNGRIATVPVSFVWQGKPAWLAHLGEALSGHTSSPTGRTQLLSSDVIDERRRQLQSLLQNSIRDDNAAVFRKLLVTATSN